MIGSPSSAMAATSRVGVRRQRSGGQRLTHRLWDGNGQRGGAEVSERVRVKPGRHKLHRAPMGDRLQRIEVREPWKPLLCGGSRRGMQGASSRDMEQTDPDDPARLLSIPEERV